MSPRIRTLLVFTLGLGLGFAALTWARACYEARAEAEADPLPGTL